MMTLRSLIRGLVRRSPPTREWPASLPPPAEAHPLDRLWPDLPVDQKETSTVNNRALTKAERRLLAGADMVGISSGTVTTTNLGATAQYIVFWQANGQNSWDGNFYASQGAADTAAQALSSMLPGVQVIVAKTLDWWKVSPAPAADTTTS